MEIKVLDSFCILTPLSPKLDKREALRLFAEAEANNSKIIGFDMTFVKDCTIDFYEELNIFAKSCYIGLFNISSDIFTIFNVMKLDKQVNLFVSEMDFKLNKRRILNRQFSIL